MRHLHGTTARSQSIMASLHFIITMIEIQRADTLVAQRLCHMYNQPIDTCN